MKKPVRHETRVAKGFVGWFIRSQSRRVRLMNISVAVMDAIRRLAVRGRLPREVEKRTYVFILVPFNFCGNGQARQANITQDLMRNGTRVDRTRTDVLFSTIVALDRASWRTISEADVSDDRKLNYDLMWTWFLPNPLWPPNENSCGLNLFPSRANWVQ
jgi:hypothetical protein